MNEGKGRFLGDASGYDLGWKPLWLIIVNVDQVVSACNFCVAQVANLVLYMNRMKVNSLIRVGLLISNSNA